jgi:hypothetical protein
LPEREGQRQCFTGRQYLELLLLSKRGLKAGSKGLVQKDVKDQTIARHLKAVRESKG